MLSFRQKLYLSYFAILVVFLALLVPVSNWVVEAITHTALNDKTDQVLELLRKENTMGAAVDHLSRHPPIFYRISIYEPDGQLVYDSALSPDAQLLPPEVYLERHPEVRDALEKGQGFGQFYSETAEEELVYFARRFEFEGKTYVVRTAFPVSQVQQFNRRFKLGFFALGAVLLVLFFSLAGFITHQLSRPIGTIIRAIRPYQEGRVEALPKIQLGRSAARGDDFTRLADTLNLLTERIESQIDTLKRERNERNALLESLVEGVVAVDPEMKVTYANPMALDMLETEELEQRPFSSVGQPEMHEILHRCQEQGEMLATTGVLGETRRLNVDLIAVPKSEGDGAVLVMQDKSVHYRLLEMRKDFIANASHELKTPITIIRGFAEAVGSNPDMSREVLEEVTEKILRNCHRMETLVHNLLRLADIENLSRANLQPCNVEALSHMCRDMVLTVYADATIDINVSGGDPVLLADPDLLELAITNLLDNGCKYSKDPGRVTVDIDVFSDQNRIQLKVCDQGIGIPAEDQEQIFQRFFTVDKAHSRKLGGSGLGLSIVKTIIEKHFGTISVTSEPGKGSCFIVLLPINLEEYA
jgi:two-component system, OmpR family, phosphate regulon sensor histidine kinase PhoR